MFIAGVCLLAVVISSFRVYRSYTAGCPEIKIMVSAPNVIENTPFAVSCISPGVNKWDWDFGDFGPHGNTSKVSHTYRSAGKYVIKLVVNGNAKCNSTLPVTVGQDLSATATGTSSIETSIEGPSTAMVGKPVKFHETSGKATTWAWTSTESNGVIDGTGQEVTYTFASPGKKTVYVNINGNKGQGSMDVLVSAPAGGGGGGDGKTKVSEDQFRKMLYQVINRKGDVSLFKDCLCGKINMVITVVDKKGKPYAFDGYCKELNSRSHRTEIDDIKLTDEPKTGCITNVVIKEHTGSLAPWRK
jgi:hypothetical protein